MGDIRHPTAKRRNIPPAKIASEGTVPVIPKATYAYNPHLPPVLRFDQHGKPDGLPELLAAAGKRPLMPEEQQTLAAALRNLEPWLEWTGKRERPAFAVDPVALHIHERISAQAILKVAARQDVTKFLFADPEQEYHEAVQFYKHDVDWSNRLVLGDSLQVMSSLARREDLAGKVQMIYMDPPYGIKFASNFQPEVGKRDVKDKQEDLTREPEMVRAYRDTWHLGIHSYLSYLRDRLIVAKDLLADTGSIFVQISDDNLHRVRMLLDEVFGAENFVSQIAFSKTSSATVLLLPSTVDHIMWYARKHDTVKYRELFATKVAGGAGGGKYDQAETRDGFRASVSQIDDAARVFRLDNITSQSVGREKGEGSACWFPVELGGRSFLPSMRNRWKTNQEGLGRLLRSERVAITGDTIGYVRFLEDFPAFTISDMWMDIGGIQSRADPKVYVVQTATEAVKRCMLMTTDPGDLVLDPTCGSGTTAYVAEQWGRRWITIDTSRVAIAIARQRLLTAKFDMYHIKGPAASATGTVQRRLDGGLSGTRQGVLAAAKPEDPTRGFIYKTVPHITLKSIAQNVALDPIFARHEPILERALTACNAALAKVPKETAAKLAVKLELKERNEGKRAVSDADRRRWALPRGAAVRKGKEEHGQDACATKEHGQDAHATWEHWTVPFDTDPDYPKDLVAAVAAYRAAWRAKMDDVNACIAASAEQEELVDQPEVVRGVTRVSGPFTVEAVQPPEMSLGDVVGGEGFDGEPEALEGGFQIRMVEPKGDLDVANVGAYLDQMFRFIKGDGVRFLNNKQMKWSRLESLFESGTANPFHAEGRWMPVGEADKDADGRANVAVAFGPQYGPVTGPVVVELLRQAHIRGYEHVVIAGFSFDGAAQTAFDNQAHPKVKIHLAHIRPDINPGMNGLLKESPQVGAGQLFTVFGQPRISVAGPGKKGTATEGEYTVTMEGVDLYNPVMDSITSSGANKVAAWFLDSDYDGRTFCVTQAFFPDRTAWEKLQKALNGKDGPIDAERFEAFSGTTSLAFPKGKHACVAVKVIDPRGNEVMAVERI